jgi:hypothetical protein
LLKYENREEDFQHFKPASVVDLRKRQQFYKTTAIQNAKFHITKNEDPHRMMVHQCPYVPVFIKRRAIVCDFMTRDLRSKLRFANGF